MRRALVFYGLSAVALVTGCNAVFGLDDKDFGAGGSGGDSSASSSSSGEVGGGLGGADPCVENLAVAGEFDAGWETFWTPTNLATDIKDEEGQPVLHAVVEDSELETLLTNSLDGHTICPGSCAKAHFSLYASSSFQLNVILDDDDQTAIRYVLHSESYQDTGIFLEVTSDTCKLDDTFASPDRYGFGTPAPGVPDYEIDDVELLIGPCAEGAKPCGTF